MSAAPGSKLKRWLQARSPRLAGELFYRSALKSFQLGLQVRGETHLQSWARNSYRLGNWVPFLSDIDISIWMAKEPNAVDLEKLRRTYQRLKRVFPVLGELNLYVATEERWISELINPFELERDPQLGMKIKSRTPIDLKVSAATFLLRMLEADIEQVLDAPETRRAKWNAHFNRVTAVAGGKDLDLWKDFPRRSLVRGIVELITYLLGVEGSERNLFIEQAELYFHGMGKKVPVHVLLPLAAGNPYLWAAFPHRLCFRLESAPELGGVWLQLAQAQLCWEVFGMLTQYRLLPPNETEKAALRTHLASLGEFHARCLAGKSDLPATDLSLRQVIDCLLTSL